MIPTALALAFIGGLVFPKRVPWVVVAVTVFWIILLLSDGLQDAGELFGGAAFGALNAVVGVGAGWGIRRLIAR